MLDKSELTCLDPADNGFTNHLTVLYQCRYYCTNATWSAAIALQSTGFRFVHELEPRSLLHLPMKAQLILACLSLSLAPRSAVPATS